MAGCDESEQHQRFRRLRHNPVPEFKEWQVWEGEIKSGYFYSEDLRGVRAELLAEGHQPRVSMRGLCEWSALRLRVPGDWTERLGVPYRGQRLAEPSLGLLQGKREDTRSRLARQTTAPPSRAASVATCTRTTRPHPGCRLSSSSCRSGISTDPVKA